MPPSDTKTIRVGTRGSPLALRQTNLMLGLLQEEFPQIDFVVHQITTRGDRIQDRPISAIGDKAVFVRSIEQALLEGQIDLAVHSLKDLPVDKETAGLQLAAFSSREDPRDVVITQQGLSLLSLPSGARVGTSSPRRRAFLAEARPDLVAADIRGNVDTRLRKLDAGEYEAIVLAAAGLRRLGLDHRIAEYLPLDRFVPDAGQGIMAVQTRSGDEVIEIVKPIDDTVSRLAATAERAVIWSLKADCHSPVGAFALIDGEALHIRGATATQDGRTILRSESTGPAREAESIGRDLGLRLRRMLGK